MEEFGQLLTKLVFNQPYRPAQLSLINNSASTSHRWNAYSHRCIHMFVNIWPWSWSLTLETFLLKNYYYYYY